MTSLARKIRLNEMAMWRREHSVQYCAGCGRKIARSSHHFFCNACHYDMKEIKFCVVCGWLVEIPGNHYCTECKPDKVDVTKERLKRSAMKCSGTERMFAEKKLLLIEIEELETELKKMNDRIADINKVLGHSSLQNAKMQNTIPQDLNLKMG